MAATARERLSRGLFVLPTLFTVGNLFCGYLSIWSSIRGTFDQSAYLIIAAGILDALDGRIARMTHSTSAFGEQYDSMADLVSFGVAPAVLAYSQTRPPVILTAAELRDEVRRVRAGLRRLGIGPGDRVAAYSPNIPETFVLMLAAAQGQVLTVSAVGPGAADCVREIGELIANRFGEAQ